VLITLDKQLLRCLAFKSSTPLSFEYKSSFPLFFTMLPAVYGESSNITSIFAFCYCGKTYENPFINRFLNAQLIRITALKPFKWINQREDYNFFLLEYQEGYIIVPTFLVAILVNQWEFLSHS